MVYKVPSRSTRPPAPLPVDRPAEWPLPPPPGMPPDPRLPKPLKDALQRPPESPRPPAR